MNIACEQPLLGVGGRGGKNDDSVCIFVFVLFIIFFSCSLVASTSHESFAISSTTEMIDKIRKAFDRFVKFRLRYANLYS